MMKNPTKPFGTAGKRKIMPVKPGMKPTFDNMDAFGAAKVTSSKKKIVAPPQYRVKKRKP